SSTLSFLFPFFLTFSSILLPPCIILSGGRTIHNSYTLFTVPIEKKPGDRCKELFDGSPEMLVGHDRETESRFTARLRIKFTEASGAQIYFKDLCPMCSDDYVNLFWRGAKNVK
ncbi:MAG: hypothetical protein V1933_08055, partial [Candidatus Omnitrophota bacterium]